MNNTYSIPFDIEAEKAILGSIIENNDLLSDVIRILQPDTFYNPNHQNIFQAMLDLNALRQPIDEVILGDQLRSKDQLVDCGGYGYFVELVDCVPSSCNLPYYARIIQEQKLLRDLIKTTSEISKRSRDPRQNVSELLADAERQITEISAARIQRGPRHIKEILADEFKKLEERSENSNEVIGIPTGFIDLDKIISGLIPTDLITVAARPSMGKTAFALNIAEHAATNTDAKGPILIFTREMSEGQSACRMLSSNGKVSTQKIKTGNMEGEDWDRLAMATERLSISNIYLDESTADINQIVHEARGLHKCHENGLALIIVDYLQLLDGPKKTNREQEIATISRAMKNLAKELRVPVIQLSQLNRDLEKRKDKRPLLSDLRESGAIEQDSDIILFIYRDEVYDENTPDRGIAEIIIGKHRNGSTGIVKLAFQGKYTKFGNLSSADMSMRSIKHVETKPHWQDQAS